jgi:hypothetical protein
LRLHERGQPKATTARHQQQAHILGRVRCGCYAPKVVKCWIRIKTAICYCHCCSRCHCIADNDSRWLC